nr:restriction endonuclease subunit S [uncultured Flavobacterium sp.]
MIKVVLSSIIDIISGGTPQTSVEEYWNNGNIGWLSVTDFNNDLRYVYESEKQITEKGLKESNTKLLQYGDIIISARGTVGALAQIGKPMCFNQSCFGIRGKKDKVDNDFLYYALKNYVQHIKKRSQGSVFDTINLKSFDLMEIEIPKSVAEQQKIAKVLSDLDAKIEGNNRINSELEAMAKTLYDYWFMQFDFPDANGKPYKTSGGKMVWNEDLKREIPEGWEVKPLNEAIETILDHRGKTPKKLGSDWTDDENGIIALSAKIVKSGKLNNLNQANKVSKELFHKWMPTKLIDGDILMTSEAPAGEFYFIQGKTDYCMSQRLFGIRANQLKMIPSYLYYELSKGNGYSQIMGSLSGSTVFGIRQDVLRKILVVVPNLEIQKEFNEIILPMMKQIKQMDEQNQELASLRDWLLPMLMNGQVSVGEFKEELRMVAEERAEYKKS